MHKKVNSTFLQEKQRSAWDHHLNKFGRLQVINALHMYKVSRYPVSWFWRRRFSKALYHIWAWWPAWSGDRNHLNKSLFAEPQGVKHEIWSQMAILASRPEPFQQTLLPPTPRRKQEFLLCNTLLGHDSHPYQLLSKYFQVYGR